MNQPFRCPMCGCEQVSPAGNVRASSTAMTVSVPLIERGFFSAPLLDVPLVASICRSCGFANLWARSDGREELEKRWSDLKYPTSG